MEKDAIFTASNCISCLVLVGPTEGEREGRNWVDGLARGGGPILASGKCPGGLPVELVPTGETLQLESLDLLVFLKFPVYFAIDCCLL